MADITDSRLHSVHIYTILCKMIKKTKRFICQNMYYLYCIYKEICDMNI